MTSTCRRLDDEQLGELLAGIRAYLQPAEAPAAASAAASAAAAAGDPTSSLQASLERLQHQSPLEERAMICAQLSKSAKIESN